jgi:exopolyphosphatase/guanosine-5'-triphosphate,3'-diphosphate pyrophosphatase
MYSTQTSNPLTSIGMPRYAAIDIGSNSIRMAAAEVVPGEVPQTLAVDREVVRLGESVFRNGALSESAIALASSVLARMAETYHKLDVIGVRAVATSAVRDARNQEEFIQRATQAIGSPIEIISGREEARLIHLGVQSTWPHPNKRLLIIDIGGGSAEIIASENAVLRDVISKPLGAVRLKEMFLGDDPPAPKHLHQMREFIDDKLAGAVRRQGEGPWHRVIGTSASASAVVCAVNRVPRSKREAADRLRASLAEIRQLYQRLSTASLAERRRVTGIGPKRAEIIVPGVAVLMRVLEMFHLPSMYHSAAGVRDGIIADLAARGVGRALAHLSRDQRREVEQMARRFGVSLGHGRAVAAMAHDIFSATQPLHQLPQPYGRLLEAAAYLHDVGHYVSDSGHHKHSYYLVANSDMPGFTNRERELIANLCRYHRKSMPAPMHPNYQALNAEEKRALVYLIPLLRLADNLDVSGDQRIQTMDCRLRDGHLALQLRSARDIDLEQWAAERVTDVFRQVYEKPLAISKARG